MTVLARDRSGAASHAVGDCSPRGERRPAKPAGPHDHAERFRRGGPGLSRHSHHAAHASASCSCRTPTASTTSPRREADRLAALGYLVVAVDIYNGKQTTDPGDLANLVANLERGHGDEDDRCRRAAFPREPEVSRRPRRRHGLGHRRDLRRSRPRAKARTLDGAITFYGPVIDRDHVIGKFPRRSARFIPTAIPIVTHDVVLDFQQRDEGRGQRFRRPGSSPPAPAGPIRKARPTTRSRTRRRGKSRCPSSSASARSR